MEATPVVIKAINAKSTNSLCLSIVNPKAPAKFYTLYSAASAIK